MSPAGPSAEAVCAKSERILDSPAIRRSVCHEDLAAVWGEISDRSPGSRRVSKQLSEFCCRARHDERISRGRAFALDRRRVHHGSHFGQTLARGRANPVAARVPLVDLALDATQPGIVRAMALWLLGRGADAHTAGTLAPLIEDPDLLVRANAIALQSAAAPQDGPPRIASPLADSVLGVRLEAAKAMLSAPVARLPAKLAEDLQVAMGEWQPALANRADFPETQVVMGGIALTIRNPEVAARAFEEATRFDAQLVDAWIMPARIAAATQGLVAATVVIDEARAANPDNAVLRRLAAEVGSLR